MTTARKTSSIETDLFGMAVEPQAPEPKAKTLKKQTPTFSEAQRPDLAATPFRPYSVVKESPTSTVIWH